MSDTPAQLNRPAPRLGEHNRYVYQEILGIPEEEWGKLETEGVFD